MTQLKLCEVHVTPCLRISSIQRLRSRRSGSQSGGGSGVALQTDPAKVAKKLITFAPMLLGR